MISKEGRGKEKNTREKNEEEIFEVMRRRLVDNLGAYLLLGEKVREAMLRVPRHKFVPEYEQKEAYIDSPLDIGHGQTISAPHMVAIMCELLELSEGNKVLEVGTGSGYNAAVMGEILGKKGHVYTVERIEALANFARENLRKTGCNNVTVVLEDGSMGYSDCAPYDRIAVACAAPYIPEPLLEQLKPGGIMVIPVGNYFQELIRVRKDSKGNIHTERKGGVAFVPLIGKHGFRKSLEY